MEIDLAIIFHRWFRQPVVMKSASNATRTHDQFPATVRTAIVHYLSTVHTKGALKTANHSLARFGQTSGTLLAHIAHL